MTWLPQRRCSNDAFDCSAACWLARKFTSFCLLLTFCLPSLIDGHKLLIKIKSMKKSSLSFWKCFNIYFMLNIQMELVLKIIYKLYIFRIKKSFQVLKIKIELIFLNKKKKIVVYKLNSCWNEKENNKKYVFRPQVVLNIWMWSVKIEWQFVRVMCVVIFTASFRVVPYHSFDCHSHVIAFVDS